MKKLILVSIIILSVSTLLSSQDPEFEYYKSKEIRTLLGRNRAGGGYGSFTMGYSVIDNQHAVLMGGRLAWVASHYVGIGFGGTGFINEYHYEPSVDKEVFLTGGYGGFYIEPILFPRLPLHFSFPTLFGAGGISYITKDQDVNSSFIDDSEAFLLIEPAVEVELNLTKFFRLALGTTYRFPTSFRVGSSDSQVVNAESLKGLSYTVTLKFGKF